MGLCFIFLIKKIQRFKIISRSISKLYDYLPHPFGKFDVIRNGGAEHNNVDVIRQQNQNFFPYNSSLHANE